MEINLCSTHCDGDFCLFVQQSVLSTSHRNLHELDAETQPLQTFQDSGLEVVVSKSERSKTSDPHLDEEGETEGGAHGQKKNQNVEITGWATGGPSLRSIAERRLCLDFRHVRHRGDGHRDGDSRGGSTQGIFLFICTEMPYQPVYYDPIGAYHHVPCQRDPGLEKALKEQLTNEKRAVFRAAGNNQYQILQHYDS
uniref:Uncharacterized protein n=1 Tax=Sphaerodactylus townsendi TaxID=933632 RepID=A0ACB8F2M9_9SAUR